MPSARAAFPSILYPHPPFPAGASPGRHQLQGVWREGCGGGYFYLRIECWCLWCPCRAVPTFPLLGAQSVAQDEGMGTLWEILLPSQLLGPHE